MQGGDGGHQGLRSMFDTFQTDSFHRVKIGVGQPQHNCQLPEYVVAEFSTIVRPAVEKGCAEAMRCVLEIIEKPSQSHLPLSKFIRAGREFGPALYFQLTFPEN